MAVEIDIAVTQGHHTDIGVGAEFVDLAAGGDKRRLVADHPGGGAEWNIDADDHIVGVDVEPIPPSGRSVGFQVRV